MSEPLDRRRFLKRSAGALGAAFLRPSGMPPVRVAVVGTGGRGTDLVRKLSTIEAAHLVAVCDDYAPHLERGAEAAGPQARAFAQYEAMLAQTSLDAVVIATPLHLHFEMAMQALDVGCAVFCEKTMCYSVDEAQSLAEAVEARGAIFQVGLQRRANAVYQQAAAMVEAGMLGRITAIKCQWHRHGDWRRPVPVGRDAPGWEALERRLNWRLFDNTSRGLMAELASHQLDVATWLLGRPPVRAIGTGGTDYWRDGREVFDNVFCVYDYAMPPDAATSPLGDDRPYTVRVTYSSLQNNAYEGASELVMGTKGTLFLTSKKGLFYREGAAEDPGWRGQADQDAALITAGQTLKMENDPWAHRGRPYEIDPTGDDTRAQLVTFLDHVQRADPATLCDVRAGLKNAATILMGHEAMRTGTAVAYPL